MENIRSKGADVKYNMPLWMHKELESHKETKEEKKEEFDLPITKEPGLYLKFALFLNFLFKFF